MRTNRRSLRLTATCGLLLASTSPALAQTDTTNVPQPPTAELAAFERFFGEYEHADSHYMGTGPWQGTLEVKSVIKGWYVAMIIRTRYGPIDRELHMLTTWDAELDRYRVWRFETTPQSPPGTIEAEARFEGDEFIMEWKESRGPQGQRGTFRNRVWMEGPDVLVTRSEAEPEGGELVVLGVWRHLRVRPVPTGSGG